MPMVVTGPSFDLQYYHSWVYWGHQQITQNGWQVGKDLCDLLISYFLCKLFLDFANELLPV